MRIEQIQAFLAVAETQSFQSAARRCGITQSTVSRQIQALETLLGLSLLRRSGAVKLTLGGEQFIPHARKIYQAWENALAELSALRQGQQAELCIAAIHSVCAYRLPPVLQQFIADYPQVQLRVTALGSDRALKVLRDGLVDVAVVMNNRILTTNMDWLVDSLYSEPVRVLVRSTHPLVSRQPVPWSALSHYPHVIFKDGYGMQRLVQERFKTLGITPQVVLELNTLDAFRGIVRQGEAVALLPESALLEAQRDPTLAVLPLAEPVIDREVVLVTTRDRLELPPIAHFRQLVCQSLRPPAAASPSAPT